MKKAISRVAIFIFLFIMIIFLKDPFARATKQQKVILFVVDYLKLNDFYLNPGLTELGRQSGIGLLNCNTEASRAIPHTYATVNAGRMSSAPRGGIQVYNADEKLGDKTAQKIFNSKTGYNVPSVSVVVFSLPQLLEQNKDNKNNLSVGQLGAQLNLAGLNTAVLGNADLPDLKDRSASLIGMNDYGYINFGDVSNNLNVITDDFIGLRTDYAKLLKSFREVYIKADFIIINLGDLVRLERSQDEALPHMILAARQMILHDISDFVSEIRKQINLENDLLLLGSLSQNPQNAYGENRLLPFLMLSKEVSGGLLSSGTTRRPGIITNTDITASVLNHFKLPYTLSIGRPINALSINSSNLKYLTALNQRLSFIYDARNPMIKTYVLLLIFTVLASVPIIFILPDIAKAMKIVLLTLTSYPLSLLLLGLIKTNSIVFYCLLSLAITAVIVLISIKVTDNWLVSFMLIEGFTAMVILADLITGASLAKFSPLSYQVITGARYYGIGNEYMGVLIGAIIISSSIANHLYPGIYAKIIITITFFIASLFIALPQLGVNFGGTITAIAAFGYILLSWQGINLSFSKAIKLGAVCLICIIAVISFDLTRSIETQSHLGRTVSLIREQGLIELYTIMTRKAAMNIKLFRYTSWSRVFIAFLLASAFMLFRPVRMFYTFKTSYPKLFAGFFGTITGSLLALVLNDSGIVASATMMIYSALPLICLATENYLIKRS